MITAEKGFSVIELLIAMAILGIVLTGIYGLAISSSQNYVAQNGIVQMQSDARAAMEFMVRELRLATTNPTAGIPAITTNVAANDTINFNRVVDTGYSTTVGGAATTLTDANKQWPANTYVPTSTSAFTVSIISGTGTGQARTITANTATLLTISPAWGVLPGTDSRYIITNIKRFTRSGTDNVLRYRIGATGLNNQLVENITALAFGQPNPNTITITLTARTSAIDPAIKQYRFYTLTESVTLRN